MQLLFLYYTGLSAFSSVTSWTDTAVFVLYFALRKEEAAKASWWVSLFRVTIKLLIDKFSKGYKSSHILYLSLRKSTLKTHTQKHTFKNCIHSVALFVLLATLASHCDKMPRLQVCVVSATICGQRVAVGEEMDGVGKVMDTGSLAQLKAYIHLALVTIVSVPVILA